MSNSGDIVYVNGHTGKYLEPAVGKANLNVFAMAREGLRTGLYRSFQKVVREGGKATARALFIEGDTTRQPVDVTIQAITEPKALQGMLLVAFNDVSRSKKVGAPKAPGKARVDEEESRLLHDELQTLREEMQSSQEELKSANEELQSANEELQSANEELSTSKEEMQSLNEELQTPNAELQWKVEELSHASSDMKNLLDSTDIATLFLDNELRVRRFTSPTTRLIKLIETDVGRPLTDLVTDLKYPELSQDAREVLRTLAFCEKAVATHSGHWYSVRIMPYRTIANVVDGVVVTFGNITQLKTLEAEFRKMEALLPSPARQKN